MASLGYYEDTPLFGGELLGIEPISSSDGLDKNLGSFERLPSDDIFPPFSPGNISSPSTDGGADEWLYSHNISEELVDGNLLAELISQFPDEELPEELTGEATVDASWSNLLAQLQQGLPPEEDAVLDLSPRPATSAAGSYMQVMSPPQSSDSGSASPYMSYDGYETSLSPIGFEANNDMNDALDRSWSPGSSDNNSESMFDLFADYKGANNTAFTSSINAVKIAPNIQPNQLAIVPSLRKGKKGRFGSTEKQLRKKEQNKNAASKYRQKKKAEQQDVNSECNQLLARNHKLKEKVGNISREIRYLKGLLKEVMKVKKNKATKGKRR